jgi:hypothetical protein
MTTRRRFIQALAAAPAVAALGTHAQAPANPSRLALAIGNNAYPNSPLLNPINDARAMGELLRSAGFTVDTLFDCSREELTEAISRFSAAAQSSEVKQVLFYYAGHALQLDWRNYLVPVDAKVESAGQVATSCFDLATILRHLGRAKDKVFVIVLDACRNDPFGSGFRPEHKGLSQFDAPAGSLLAYATAPGSVAADGEGDKGLYTSNLVRELSVKGIKLEDAFKRTRLNVRLASHGTQVPWETTSLETDFFLFEETRRKLSEDELEAEAQTDIAMWNAAKQSKKAEDWIAYLGRFPNGRFAEMAHMRLARLQPIGGTPAADPGPPRIVTEAQSAAGQKAGRPARPLIEIAKGLPVPELFRSPPNPNSAGKYPLGRRFTVGDEGVGVMSSPIGAKPREYTVRVTKVDEDRDRVEWNSVGFVGAFVTDLMGNATETNGIAFDPPRQFVPAELYVGNHWRAAYRETQVEARQGLPLGDTRVVTYQFSIVARERIAVASGEFDAFRIEGYGRVGDLILEERIWVLPYFNFQLRWDRRRYGPPGRTLLWSHTRESVSARQYSIAS